MPATVGVAVGVDGARYAASKVAKLARRVDWLGLAEPAITAARKRLGKASVDTDVASVLGFHPLEVLRNLLKR
jgi:hypothetical protein